MYLPDSIFAPRSCSALPPIGRLWPSDDGGGGGDDDCDNDDDGVDQWFSKVDISAISAFCCNFEVCNFLFCQLEKVTCERTGGTSGRQELGTTLNKDCIYEACPEKSTVICLDLISV